MIAIIFGVTGQDGSYLTELLLEKQYEVIGVKRRSSTNNLGRIKHLIGNPNLKLVEGDITDSVSVNQLINKYKPDEIYNLAAMSHVGTSFEQPVYTFHVNAVGTLNILEAVRQFHPIAKVFHASTSELFANHYKIDKEGKKYQDEDTIMDANSPYGVAKLAAHNLIRIYKDAYGLFCCAGLTFNHESVPEDCPVIVRVDGDVDVLPIRYVAQMCGLSIKSDKQQISPAINIEVWDKNGWAKITCASAYRYNGKIREIKSPQNIYEATDDHICITNEGEIKTADLDMDSTLSSAYPKLKNVKYNPVTLHEAEFLGIAARYGWIEPDDGYDVCFVINAPEEILNRAANLWVAFNNVDNQKTFKIVDGVLECRGPINCADIHIFLNERSNKIPYVIFNSNVDIMRAFLIGYTGGANFDVVVAETKVMAAGLLWLLYNVMGSYYYVKKTNNYILTRDNSLPNSVYSNEPIEYDGFLFDLETESGTFRAGVGATLLHNSPRRGEEFVTRKITLWLADFYHTIWKNYKNIEFTDEYIKCGKLTYPKLRLGNLNAYRDWSHSQDVVRAFWMMLQNNKPVDYVISSGICHSVGGFCEVAFKELYIDNWRDFIYVDPVFFRPVEVEYLCGDSTKIRTELGWKPQITFNELVKDMVWSDINEYKSG